jgi:hypothetical protein
VILAVLRPDDWNLPLFLHVLGAMMLVGSLTAVVTGLVVASRPNGDVQTALSRFGFRTLFALVLPSYVLMRIGAEWIRSKEYGEGADDPGWVGFGYIVSDLGALLLLIALILSGIGLVRARRSGNPPRNLARTVLVIAAILLAAYLIAVWAMTAKPG